MSDRKSAVSAEVRGEGIAINIATSTSPEDSEIDASSMDGRILPRRLQGEC